MANTHTADPGGADFRLHLLSYLTLALLLIGYPAWRMAVGYAGLFAAEDPSERWWNLWSIIFVGHWLCAALVLTALKSEGASWRSIGLDLSYLSRHRFRLLGLISCALIIAAFAPNWLYGDELPEQMRSHPLGPISAAQRVFWVAMAVTAGLVEEIVFRGYALTRLKRVLGMPLAVLISLLAFALMHGPSALMLPYLSIYLIAGFAFSAAFVYCRYSRLEWLIMIHALLDLSLIIAP